MHGTLNRTVPRKFPWGVLGLAFADKNGRG